jgi:hypothetical protein
MLRLTAGTALVHYQTMCHSTGNVCAEIFLHHAECHIQPGCHASRCPDSVINNKNTSSAE